MHLMLSVLAAIIPSCVLIAYFYFRDRRREPHSVLAWTFFLGVLTVVPVLGIGLPALAVMPSFGDWSPTSAALLQALYMAFLCASIPEELCKYAVLMGYSARHKAFNEPMDGVIYGAVASLGFATLENIMYVTGGDWGVAIARALTAVPLHAFIGATLGYYVGQARFNQASKLTALGGLVVAILIHGIYDFGLMGVMQLAVRSELNPESLTGSQALLILGLMGVSLVTLVAAGIKTLLVVRHLNRQQHHEDLQIASVPVTVVGVEPSTQGSERAGG